ncbi:hypothetical protein IPM19_00695 [bacterium]|nr:MAG: hypothetical protein IPM19_00695 [bacterium]
MKLDLKAILPFILKRFSLVLWVFLGLVIIAEAFVIKSSIAKMNKAQEQSQFANSQLVRVNFDSYEAIEKRLSENASFVPSTPTSGDPFGVVTLTDE